MLIECRECKREISSEAQNCPHCGCPVRQGEKVKKVEKLDDDKKPCPYCGQPVLKTANKCNHCTGNLPVCPKCNQTVAVEEKNKFVGMARGGTQKVGFCKICGTKLYGPDCFIATAAFGSPLDAEVVHLRRFRDAVLIQHLVGRLLVSAYYKVSPPIAGRIRGSGSIRAVIRFLLRPIVYVVRRLSE